MKLGIDIHGTIDTDPEFFRKMLTLLHDAGVEIHITTGVTLDIAIRELTKLRIPFDVIFSIVSYHQALSTDIFWDETSRPWINGEMWDRTKADYCKRENVDIHIDDSPIYGKYFETPYLQFKGFRKNP